MPRLKDPRREALAWWLACGLGADAANVAAGFSMGGAASARVNEAEVRARMAELAVLAELGAGPDSCSQALAELALKCREMGTPTGLDAAARIAQRAFAAREKALARPPPEPTRRKRSGPRRYTPPEPGLAPLTPEEWLARYGPKDAA